MSFGRGNPALFCDVWLIGQVLAGWSRKLQCWGHEGGYWRSPGPQQSVDVEAFQHFPTCFNWLPTPFRIRTFCTWGKNALRSVGRYMSSPRQMRPVIMSSQSNLTQPDPTWPNLIQPRSSKECLFTEECCLVYRDFQAHRCPKHPKAPKSTQVKIPFLVIYPRVIKDLFAKRLSNHFISLVLPAISYTWLSLTVRADLFWLEPTGTPQGHLRRLYVWFPEGSQNTTCDNDPNASKCVISVSH